MKVFFDIITNHADVIDYTQKQYSYRNKTDYPYRDANGVAFNDRDYVNEPFPPMDPAVSFPYTPFFNTTADADAKFPDWLDNPIYYHNRGDSTFAGESSEYGDFIGLDDLFTERPEVEKGMEEIYKAWIDLGIDGFRIDTAKHVNLEFWQCSRRRCSSTRRTGHDDFFMFGEVFDANPAFQSIYSTAGMLPATLDFGFQQAAVAFTNGNESTVLANMFAGDDYYTDADSNAYNLPTFLGNHDMGRIGRFVDGSLAKVDFANALMFTLRGQPVIYYGDEQGFIGDGGDKDARQDMFASQVASYNDDLMIGSAPTGSPDRYGTNGEVFRNIAELSRSGPRTPRCRTGRRSALRQRLRRHLRRQPRRRGRADRVPRRRQQQRLRETATFATYTKNGKFRPIYGGGASLTVGAEGQVTVTVPPLTVRVYRRPGRSSAAKLRRRSRSRPQPADVLSGRAEVQAGVPANQFTQVTFAYRPVGVTDWTLLGTDDNPTYVVFHDVWVSRGHPDRVPRDRDGQCWPPLRWLPMGTVGTPPPPPPGGGVGDVPHPNAVATSRSTLNSDRAALPTTARPGGLGAVVHQARYARHQDDKIWKGSTRCPSEAIRLQGRFNRTWNEKIRVRPVPSGAGIEITAGATR